MNLVFFGTGSYAAEALKTFSCGEHRLNGIVSMPDRGKNRSGDILTNPVKSQAVSIFDDVPFYQPQDPNSSEFSGRIKKDCPDLIIVADYGFKLSDELLGIPKKYCINLHASLLPRWRGASPVNRAILAGDKKTGNSIIKLTSKMDAGPILLQEETEIKPHEDAENLLRRLAKTSGFLLSRALDIIDKGEEKFLAQDEKNVTYAPKILKSEGLISWESDSEYILRHVRAFKPWPGSYTFLHNKRLKIIQVSLVDGDFPGKPGQVIDPEEFVVLCGKGAVRVEKLQAAGKKIMDSRSFLRGNPVKKNTLLGPELG